MKSSSISLPDNTWWRESYTDQMTKLLSILGAYESTLDSITRDAAIVRAERDAFKYIIDNFIKVESAKTKRRRWAGMTREEKVAEIRKALTGSGSYSQAAKSIGMNPSNFYALAKKYGVITPRKRA